MATGLLVDQAHQLSRRLAGLLRALKEDPLMRDGSKKDTADFYFEVVLLSDLLESIEKAGYRITAVRRQGRIRLPRKPAKKENFSYFSVAPANGGETEYEVTHGTFIGDKWGEGRRAPDLALQRPTADEMPTHQHVVAVWDGKLKGQSKSPVKDRLDHNDVAAFAQIVQQIGVAPPSGKGKAPGFLPSAFSVSAVVTNAKFPKDPVNYFLEFGFSCVAEYAGAGTPANPTRQQHVASGQPRSKK